MLVIAILIFIFTEKEIKILFVLVMRTHIILRIFKSTILANGKYTISIVNMFVPTSLELIYLIVEISAIRLLCGLWNKHSFMIY